MLAAGDGDIQIISSPAAARRAERGRQSPRRGAAGAGKAPAPRASGETEAAEGVQTSFAE